MAGNDNFADALSVDITGTSGTYTSPAIPNDTFTTEANEPGGHYASAWWKYTPLANGTADLNTHATTAEGAYPSTDTVLEVYTGTPNPAVAGWGLAQAAYNDDDVGLTSGIYAFPVTAGTTYWVRVTAYGSPGTMSYVLAVTGPGTVQLSTIDIDVQLTAALAVAKPLAAGLDIDIRLAQPDTVDVPPADAALDATAAVADSTTAPPADTTLDVDPPYVVSQRTIPAPAASAKLAATPPALRNTGGVGMPTPAGPTPMPTAMWYLVAYRSGEPDGFISELRSAKSVKFTASLDTANTPDQIDFTINGSSPDMALLTDPRGVDVVLMCNEDRLLRCRVLNNSGTAAGDGSHDVSYTAKGYTDWLGAYVLYDTDAAVDPGYTLVEAEEIGWDLIQVAMSRPYAKLGITRGADQATGIVRTRTSFKQGDKISDLITKLGESNEVDDKTAGQFEWWVDAGLVYRVFPNGRGNHDATFLIDSGGAARAFDYRGDLSSSVNVVVAEGQDFARGIVESPDLATDPGGRCEMFVTADWVPAGPDNTTIEGYARWVLLQHSNIPEVTVQLDTAHWITPADCWLGDFVVLDLAEGYVAIQRNDLRVVEVQGVITDSGQAGITLTVGRKFPGIFQAIDQLVNTPAAPVNPLPKGSNGKVLGYQDGWKAIDPMGGIQVFIQPNDPAALAGTGDFWYMTT